MCMPSGITSWTLVLALLALRAGMPADATTHLPRADANHDGVIDVDDLLQFCEGQRTGDLRFDLDQDGRLTARDWFLFSAAWGTLVPTPTPTWTPSFTPTPTRTATPTPTRSPTPTLPPGAIVVDFPNLPDGVMKLVLLDIPAGGFIMGRYPGEVDSLPDEDPSRQVKITDRFYLGQCEITKAQWLGLVGTAPWEGHGPGLSDPDSPAVYLTWNDVVGPEGLLDKLNALGQGTFRLPSEAEWEYACRAQTGARYYWGNDFDHTQIGQYAWYSGNTVSVGEAYPHVVARKKPNPWGLFDMSGNVRELCEDWYHSSYWGAPGNGVPWLYPEGEIRVARGGSWNTLPEFCRSASRYPGSTPADLGVRIARSVPTTTPGPTPPPRITVKLPNLELGYQELVMIRIPHGVYPMGRWPFEQHSLAEEDPLHNVNIGYPFYMGKYELTKAQWIAVMGAATVPWRGQSHVLEDLDSPAVYISLDEAHAFIDALNGLGLGHFRLPSESEWEYACRAGTTTRFYWGDDPNYADLPRYAWCFENTVETNQQYAHLVGRKLRNLWELHDMSGNVWEWCEDDWHDGYGGAGRPDNGAPWIDTPRGPFRVARGGGWFNYPADPWYYRSAARPAFPAAYRDSNIGFRLVREP